MTTQRYDYAALKLEFVSAQPRITLSDLGRKHGIPDARLSSLHRRAKEEDWEGLRDKALERTDEKVVERISSIEANRRLRRLQVEDNALELINESLEKMRSDMKRTKKEKDPETGEYELVPAVTYRPEQVVQLIDRIGKLFTADGVVPDSAPVSPNLTQINFGDFNPDDPSHRALAAEVVERTRGSGSSRGRAAGSSPLPSAPGSGEDQQR